MIELRPFGFLKLSLFIILSIVLYHYIHQGMVIEYLDQSIWYTFLMPIVFIVYFLYTYQIDPLYYKSFKKRSDKTFVITFLQGIISSIADLLIWILSHSILILHNVSYVEFSYMILYDLVFYYFVSSFILSIAPNHLLSLFYMIIWFLMPLLPFDWIETYWPITIYHLQTLGFVFLISPLMYLLKLLKY